MATSPCLNSPNRLFGRWPQWRSFRRSRGHLLNWYDTRTLEPLRPRFVSSVDSGNLVASLWTLQQGCLDLLQRPLLEKQLAEGLADHLRILVDRHAFPQKRFRNFLAQVRKRSWLQRLLAPSEEGLLETDLETKDPKARIGRSLVRGRVAIPRQKSPESSSGLRSMDAAGVHPAVERRHARL